MTTHMNTQSEPQKGTIKGWHVLAMILAFFGVTITVNVIFITQAVSSFPGEDVPKSYMQGIHYNDVLAAREAQAKLGWTAALEIDQSGAVPIVLVALTSAEGDPLSGAVLEGRIRRPATTAFDSNFVFVPAGPGLYSADLPAIGQGRWEVSFTAQRGEDSFTAEREIIVK